MLAMNCFSYIQNLVYKKTKGLKKSGLFVRFKQVLRIRMAKYKVGILKVDHLNKER